MNSHQNQTVVFHFKSLKKVQKIRVLQLTWFSNETRKTKPKESEKLTTRGMRYLPKRKPKIKRYKTLNFVKGLKKQREAKRLKSSTSRHN